MNFDFEKYSSRQTVRPIPPEWRGEILRAAQTPRAEAAPVPWWREWLWPSPQAWAGLAAAWGIVFLLHSTAPSEPQSGRNTTPMTWQAFALLQHEMEVIAQSPDSIESAGAARPEPVAPQPRTSRRIKQGIG